MISYDTDNDNDIKSIIISYFKDNKMIENTLKLNNRKIIVKNHYLFIQLLEDDGIDNFFEIDVKELKETYENNDIILLQYIYKENGYNNFCFLKGKIIKNNENIKSQIFHNIPTSMGALGSPIILRNNHYYYIIGIHVGHNLIKRWKFFVNVFSIFNDI